MSVAMIAIAWRAHAQDHGVQSVVIQAVTIFDRNDSETEVVITATGSFRAVPFELLSPPRMVVDVPDVGFSLPKTPSPHPTRLVTGYRYGSLGAGRGRIVLDTRVRSVVASRASRRRGKLHEFRLVLTPRTQAQEAERKARPALRQSQFSPRERRERQRTKTPVVVIDPGHGGVDPGAVTQGGLAEKTIALSVARRLAAVLRKVDKYKVIMTRSTDKFVSLDERIEISERADADLFISLHADAVGDQSIANAVRGATIYTVSDQASDEVARALAEKENAADGRGGVTVGKDAQSQAVRSILFDLLRRESTDRAARFRELLIKRLGRTIALSRSPRRAAAFKVLKQIKTPAVLIELGYMSNVTDQALMQTADWQAKVTHAIAKAVETQFERR